MKLKPSFFITDLRWLNGIEDLNRKTSSDAIEPVEFDPFADADVEEDSLLKCTTCNVSLDADDRAALTAHYRGELHRRNLSRVTHGKEALTEEMYEEKLGEDEKMSSLSDSDDEYRTLESVLGSSHEYFVQDDQVFSIYKCLLSPTIPLDSTFFRQPIDCAIFLLTSGHFAGAVFENRTMTFHKTIHRYTVRAKQGGAQSANDCGKGPAKSAGAALRRYNERTLKAEIGQLIKEWSAPLESTPLIFLRCSSYQRQTFTAEGLIDKKDPRLRSIPFETNRPTIDEVKRTWEQLGSVFAHGNKEEFLAEMERKRQFRKKTQTAQRKKKEQELASLGSSDEERDESERERKFEEKARRKAAKLEAEREERLATDPWAHLAKEWRNTLYTTVRNNDVEAFTEHLSSTSYCEKDVQAYLTECKFPPDGNTVMHICAKNGFSNILNYLLEYGYNCSIRNDAKQTPYQTATTKSIRSLFIEHRRRIGERNGIDWAATNIPIPAQQVEKDEEALEIERQKKKAKKDRQKERVKDRKEEDRKTKIEEATKAEWLSMSDRERRARAAEARLTALERKDEEIRCFQCGKAIGGQPFEYSSNLFCSPACVAAHRANRPVQKVI